MTKDEQQYLSDLKSLDDIHQGMILPSVKVKQPEKVRDRLLERGWIWTDGRTASWGDPIVFLGTRGLRALQRRLSEQERSREDDS